MTLLSSLLEVDSDAIVACCLRESKRVLVKYLSKVCLLFDADLWHDTCYLLLSKFAKQQQQKVELLDIDKE